MAEYGDYGPLRDLEKLGDKKTITAQTRNSHNLRPDHLKPNITISWDQTASSGFEAERFAAAMDSNQGDESKLTQDFNGDSNLKYEASSRHSEASHLQQSQLLELAEKIKEMQRWTASLQTVALQRQGSGNSDEETRPVVSGVLSRSELNQIKVNKRSHESPENAQDLQQLKLMESKAPDQQSAIGAEPLPVESRLLHRGNEFNELRTETSQIQSNSVQGSIRSPKLRRSTDPCYKIVYRIDQKEIYLDEPQWQRGEGNRLYLISRIPVYDLNRHLRRIPDNVVFLVIRDYHSRSKPGKGKTTLKINTLTSPQPISESIQVVSTATIEALSMLLSHLPNSSMIFDSVALDEEISAPYLIFYHALPYWDNSVSKMSLEWQSLLQPLNDFLIKTQTVIYAAVKKELQSGHISSRSIGFLIKPGDILIGKSEGKTVGFMAESWLWNDSEVLHANPSNGPAIGNSDGQRISSNYHHMKLSSYNSSNHADSNAEDSRNPISKPNWISKDGKTPTLWRVRAWTWQFDGSFEMQFWDLPITLNTEDPDVPMTITKLDYYPMKYATDETRTLLRRRSATFWTFRSKQLVSYNKNDAGVGETTDERYVVDMKTYRRLHKDTVKPPFKDDLGLNIMTEDTPPQNGTELLFPPSVVAYNLRRKLDIEVDNISDVQWNKGTFTNLVVPEKSKELIQALVMHQIASHKSTDLIQGKGNGLIILLHGGPGTGKTFTAESVAELAEKPLYRVTCGDIGTKPEDIEQYLESVLRLGKIWDCIVLLDEADVFLEERTLSDLQRNALVSVFLRILEYHDGILILTSNRVGTFDAAFKSRIHLSLHYENLRTPERRKIWRNLMKHLKEMGENDVDYEDVNDRLDDLASKELNGREIRNTITIGRQLAKYQGKSLCYEHLDHVIEVGDNFNRYLLDLQDGLTSDEVARSDRVR